VTKGATTKRRAAKRNGAEKSLGAELIEGLQQAIAYERGDLAPGAVRVWTVPLTARDAAPEPAPAFGAERVAQLRARLKLSQPVFAHALNVSPGTVKAWEQGRRTPDGAALRLLQVAERDAAPVLEAAAIIVRTEQPRRAAARERRQSR
jgi:putative transcriptional regulator